MPLSEIKMSLFWEEAVYYYLLLRNASQAFSRPAPFSLFYKLGSPHQHDHTNSLMMTSGGTDSSQLMIASQPLTKAAAKWRWETELEPEKRHEPKKVGSHQNFTISPADPFNVKAILELVFTYIGIFEKCSLNQSVPTWLSKPMPTQFIIFLFPETLWLPHSPHHYRLGPTFCCSWLATGMCEQKAAESSNSYCRKQTLLDQREGRRDHITILPSLSVVPILSVPVSTLRGRDHDLLSFAHPASSSEVGF